MRNVLLFLFIILSATVSAQENSKLSSYVRNIVNGISSRTSKKKSVMAASAMRNTCLTALVKCSDREVLTDNGCRILADFDDDIFIAAIPLSRVNSLASHKEVKRIEAGKPCDICCDTISGIIGSTDTWSYICSQKTDNGFPKYDASGTIVGVMDVGFDLTHPSFYNSDGTKYRIRRLWDMLATDSIGNVPAIDDNIFSTSLGEHPTHGIIGREYTTTEQLFSKAHSTDGAIAAHGTHTATTAAGSGFDGTQRTGYTLYAGSESMPDIVLVCNMVTSNKSCIPDSLQYLYTSALDLLGFKYIFDYAKSVGKPCVINFSEGMTEDFYNQNLYEDVLRQLTGPGRIIVSSAGNNGRNKSYLHRTADQKSASSLFNGSKKYAEMIFCTPDSFNIELSFKAQNAEPVLYNVSSKISLKDSAYIDTLTVGDIDYGIYHIYYNNCHDTLQLGGELLLFPLNDNSLGSNGTSVSITIRGNEEVFLCSDSFISTSSFPSDAISYKNINYPSSANAVISVAANAYRPYITNYDGQKKEYEDVIPGERSTYSSIGPSVKGNIKPDITAPGTNIVAGMSSFFLEANPKSSTVSWDTEHFDFNGRTYGWNSNSGTSMAAPVVTGIIAMWLTACPSLTKDNIIEVFSATANRIGDISSFPNNEYGYGEIDALAGLNYIMEHFASDGIKEVTVAPEDNSHSVSFPYVYDLTGRRVSANNQSRGIYIKNGRKVID